MAYRAMINKVLRRLREDTISADWIGALEDSADVDSYHKLVGDFINESKQIVDKIYTTSLKLGTLKKLEEDLKSFNKKNK